MDARCAETGPATDHAAAAAAEVEQRANLLDPPAVPRKRLRDALGGEAATLEEPPDVCRSRDPHDQPRGRYREPVVGGRGGPSGRPQRTECLVGAVGGPKQAEAAEQVQSPSLHARER